MDSIIEHRPDNDADGRVTKFVYDDLSRRIAVIENYEDAAIAWNNTDDRWEVTSGLSTSQPDTDRVTSFAYDGIGNVVKQVAHLPDVSLAEVVQVTQYVYDAQISTGSLLDSKALLSEVHYPDRGSGAPGTTGYTVAYQYNRLGELTALTDQNGTMHSYERDSLGRVIEDNAAVAGGNPHAIDIAVMGIHVAYDTFGRLDTVKSIDDPTAGTPVVMNEAKFTYTPLWQVEDIHQDVDSELNSITDGIVPTRVVHYDYDTVAVGSGNYSRLNHMNYPSGASYDHFYGSTATNDRISRLDEFQVDGSIKLAKYHHVGLSMFAVVDYETPDVQLDRTLDVTGARRWSSFTTQAANTYPGWDRFGRVIKQFWVDGALTTGPNSLPDRPQIVAETYAYDRAFNRMSKDEVRDGLLWASQDNDYAYDMLDRLNLATRGRRGGGGSITAAGGIIDSSQQWTLDMLGNWDLFQRDRNGNGTFGDAAVLPSPPGNIGDLDDTRDHNFANEVDESGLRHDATSPTPVAVPFTYDDAGNITSARMETTGPDPVTNANLVSRQYIHDAWNRLVEVKNNNGTVGTTGDDFTIARYGYNGMHWRVLKRSDTDPAQATPSSPATDGTDRLEAMFYDSSWRLIEREILDGYAPSSPPSSWTAGRAEELFWGARYIDDAVARRQSSSFDGSAESISVTWNDLEWYLTDAQFSVVARVDIGALVLERVRYDPYGNAQHIDAGDFNGNGQVSVQDIFDWLAVYLAATPPPKPLTADFNRDGAVGTQDNFDYQFHFFGPGPDATEGSVSSADIANGGSDSIVGYCGYVFNHETSQYTVRFRHYSPELGRWLERDPVEYKDGLSLYQYVVSQPVALSDASGLSATDRGTLKDDIVRRGLQGAPHFQPGDKYTKEYAKQSCEWGLKAGFNASAKLLRLSSAYAKLGCGSQLGSPQAYAVTAASFIDFGLGTSNSLFVTVITNAGNVPGSWWGLLADLAYNYSRIGERLEGGDIDWNAFKHASLVGGACTSASLEKLFAKHVAGLAGARAAVAGTGVGAVIVVAAEVAAALIEYNAAVTSRIGMQEGRLSECQLLKDQLDGHSTVLKHASEAAKDCKEVCKCK